MTVKALDLFDAFEKGLLPKEQGYIVSSFFKPNSAYSRYEIVSYKNVKSIYPSGEGLTFQTDGKKLFILSEPQNYSAKSAEPYIRSSAEQIPLRFSELDCHTAKNQTRVYYSKKAVLSYGAFTVLKPTGVNFAFCFYFLPDIFDSMQVFFEKTFNKEAGVPLADAKKVAAAVIKTAREALAVEYTS
ncbi:MAG TPA: hypothetical protein VLH39_08760 [Magnetospirillaceae bacterium]|nr:hypothetical protein [Magnetospirillaceae bacterium]